MLFWKVKCPLGTLLLGDGQVFVSVGIEEKRVLSPREGFSTNVEVLVVGRERDVAIVLGHEVLLVLSVFTLNLLHPEVTSCDRGKTAVEADLTPEVGGAFSVMYDGFAFCGPVFGSSVDNDGAG